MVRGTLDVPVMRVAEGRTPNDDRLELVRWLEEALSSARCSSRHRRRAVTRLMRRLRTFGSGVEHELLERMLEEGRQDLVLRGLPRWQWTAGRVRDACLRHRWITGVVSAAALMLLVWGVVETAQAAGKKSHLQGVRVRARSLFEFGQWGGLDALLRENSDAASEDPVLLSYRALLPIGRDCDLESGVGAAVLPDMARAAAASQAEFLQAAEKHKRCVLQWAHRVMASGETFDSSLQPAFWLIVLRVVSSVLADIPEDRAPDKSNARLLQQIGDLARPAVQREVPPSGKASIHYAALLACGVEASWRRINPDTECSHEGATAEAMLEVCARAVQWGLYNAYEMRCYSALAEAAQDLARGSSSASTLAELVRLATPDAQREAKEQMRAALCQFYRESEIPDETAYGGIWLLAARCERMVARLKGR
jgi:hypothetical protein